MNFNSVEEILEFIETLPEESFCIYEFFRGKQCCVLGHLYRVMGNGDYLVSNMYDHDISSFVEDRFRKLTSLFLKTKDSHKYQDIADVNNGQCEFYTQESPKKRVVAFLYDMIEEGYHFGMIKN